MKVLPSIIALIIVYNPLPTYSIESTVTPSSAARTLADGIILFRNAYITWNVEQFKEAEKQIEMSIAQGIKNHLPHYWKGVINFHLVNLHLWGTKEVADKRKGTIYINRAIESLKKALQHNDRDPESLALTGTLYGIKIYQKPYLALFLGPKAFKMIEAGLDIEPENPRIHYLIGMRYLFTPKYLGGGVKKGLSYLLNAHTFFEKEADMKSGPCEPRWGYSTCLNFIGKTYMKLNNSKEAEHYFKKVLTINPKDKLAKSGLDELTKQKGR